MTTKQQAALHVKNILDAMNALNRVWDDNMDEFNELLQPNFPFNHSFDEVCTDVEVWLESIHAEAPAPEYFYMWKDKSGRGETRTDIPLGDISTSEELSWDGAELGEWAMDANIGDTWENRTDYYIRTV